MNIIKWVVHKIATHFGYIDGDTYTKLKLDNFNNMELIRKLKATVDSRDADINALTSSIEDAKESHKSLNSAYSNLNNINCELKAENHELKQQLEDCYTDYTNMSATNNILSSEVEELTAKLSEVAETVNAIEGNAAYKQRFEELVQIPMSEDLHGSKYFGFPNSPTIPNSVVFDVEPYNHSDVVIRTRMAFTEKTSNELDGISNPYAQANRAFEVANRFGQYDLIGKALYDHGLMQVNLAKTDKGLYEFYSYINLPKTTISENYATVEEIPGAVIIDLKKYR